MSDREPKTQGMVSAMNYLRGWVGRADWRVLLVSLVQSWIVMAALIFVGLAVVTGWWWAYLAAVVLAAAEVPLGITFMTNWRFDVKHYIRVVDRVGC